MNCVLAGVEFTTFFEHYGLVRTGRASGTQVEASGSPGPKAGWGYSSAGAYCCDEDTLLSSFVDGARGFLSKD